MYLIKKNSASKTVSLFFLIPVVTALMAWLFLGEVLMKIDKNLFPKYRDKLIKKLVDNNIRVEYLEILSRKNLSENYDKFQ